MASKSDTGNVDRNVTEPTTVTAQSPFQRFLRTMEMEATAEVEAGRPDGDDLTAIITAEKEEDIWEADERGPLNAQHLAGCELELIDVQVKFSRGGQNELASAFVTSDGKKMYLLVTAARISDAGSKAHLRLPDIGEQFQFSTGARFLVAKIFHFYLVGRINADTGKTLECMIRATELSDGQAVLKLRPVPTRAVRTVTE